MSAGQLPRLSATLIFLLRWHDGYTAFSIHQMGFRARYILCYYLELL